MASWLPSDPTFATKAIHSGYTPKNEKYAPIVPPISLATTFEQDGPGQDRGYEYTRSGNPTRTVLESTLAALDNGKYGFVFASGMAAICNVIVSMLQAGDGVLLCDDIYSGTGRIFRRFADSFGITVDSLDLSLDVLALEKALKPNTKLVWIETPSNPMLKIINIQKTVEICRKHSREVLVAVDNTFLTAYFQRPLAFGVDMVIYSLSKFTNGMSDVLMGAIVTSREDLRDRIRLHQNALGGVPSPFDCYMVLRSLRTLHVRMPAHMRNGLEIAKFLEKHANVKRVLHPGLPSHPQHALALKQASGHSGLICFYTKEKSAERFLTRLRLFRIAVSLGGAESMASVPSLMTHALIPEEKKVALGITDSYVRLSIGLESLPDLIRDLDQALQIP